MHLFQHRNNITKHKRLAGPGRLCFRKGRAMAIGAKQLTIFDIYPEHCTRNAATSEENKYHEASVSVYDAIFQNTKKKRNITISTRYSSGSKRTKWFVATNDYRTVGYNDLETLCGDWNLDRNTILKALE